MSDQPELELKSDAAKTLRTLEGFVKRAETRLNLANETLENAMLGKIPPQLDGADPDAFVSKARAEAKAAEDSYLKFSSALLNFDKNVGVDRREATEQIPKADVIRTFEMFALHLRGALENSVSRFCQEAMEVRTPEEMYEKFVEIDRSCYESALKSALQESHLPKWAVDAFLNYV